MKKRIFALVVVLAMVISIMPMSVATVSAATGANQVGAKESVLYSSVDNWNSGYYSMYTPTDGVYTIPVTGTTGTKSQAFRVNSKSLELNTTYIMSLKAKTDGTFTDVKFHNGHSCLNLVSTKVLGATSIGNDWTELKYALEFKEGSNLSDPTSCNVASHGKLTPFGGTKAPIIHAGVYFKSATDCTLQIKDYAFYKIETGTVASSMVSTENVGDTAEITYTLTAVPTAAPTVDNFKLEGGVGSVTNVVKVNDTQYKVTVTGLVPKKEYKVTLSGLIDSDVEVPFANNTITFSTVGYISDPNVYAYENFDADVAGQASTFFTGGNQVIQLKEGSTTDKVLALSTYTDKATQINFKLGKAVDATSGIVEFSFDLYRVGNHEQLVRFYLGGGSVISGQFYRDKLATYPDQGILGALGQNRWNKVSIRVDMASQRYTVAVDDKLTVDEDGFAKEFTFRNPITSIANGYFNMDANTTSTKTILIDNFKVAKVEDAEVGKTVAYYYDYENGTSTGISGNFTSVVSKRNDGVAENGVETGKALEIKYPEGASSSTSGSFALATPIKSGIAEVSFDIYRSSDAPTVQFYMNSSTSKRAVNSPIANNGWIGEHSNSGRLVQIPTNKWVNVVYKMNMYTKTFSIVVDGVEYSTYDGTVMKFRDAVCENLSSLTLYTYGSDSTTATKVQIDNLKITNDVTNYHMSVTGDGILTDTTNKTLSHCPVGSTVGDFVDSLYVSPAGCIAEVYTADGITKKADSDVLEKYDIVKVVYAEKGVMTNFTVLPDYSIDFIGIEVNGNEYYEASKILEPGEATVRARITNNTTEDKTFMVYASVVDNKLYDVELKKNITVPALTTGGVIKFDVELPDTNDSAKLKLIVVDPQDGLTPLCDAETKLVYSSQIVRLPNVFTDHMVLQRNEPVNIFGWAPTGSDVTVTFGEYSATGVAKDGKFLVQLPSMSADSTGKNLVITAAGETITLTDVVVGEVLYGSGQSNMQRGVSYADGAIALGQMPNIRAFTSQSLYSTKGRVDDTISEAWGILGDNNWKNVSGTMYATAYYLRELGAIPEDVIIGLVTASWGGTSIAMWLPADSLEAGPHTAYYTSYVNRTPDSKGVRNTDLYSAMAKSVVPYTAKAAVWYQGEHDSGITTYNWYMDEYVRVMREDFGKDIPYYIVQLPGFSTASWSQFRLTQWKSHDPENGVHVVVTNDTGDNDDIHPHDKDLVGERIARQIAAQTYGMENIPYQGPVFKSATANGSQVTISFDYVNDGIHGGLCSLASDNSLTKFEVSADGTTWKAATASISGDTIVVSSAEVSAPKYVRYGYIPQILKSAGTNTNGVKLPLAPFSEAIN